MIILGVVQPKMRKIFRIVFFCCGLFWYAKDALSCDADQHAFSIDQLAFATGIGNEIHCLYFQTGKNRFARLFSSSSQFGLGAYAAQQVQFHGFEQKTNIAKIVTPNQFFPSEKYNSLIRKYSGYRGVALSLKNRPYLSDIIIGFRRISKKKKYRRGEVYQPRILASEFPSPGELVVDLLSSTFDGLSVGTTQEQIDLIYSHIMSKQFDHLSLRFDTQTPRIAYTHDVYTYTKHLEATILHAQEFQPVLNQLLASIPRAAGDSLPKSDIATDSETDFTSSDEEGPKIANTPLGLLPSVGAPTTRTRRGGRRNTTTPRPAIVLDRWGP